MPGILSAAPDGAAYHRLPAVTGAPIRPVRPVRPGGVVAIPRRGRHVAAGPVRPRVAVRGSTRDVAIRRPRPIVARAVPPRSVGPVGRPSREVPPVDRPHRRPHPVVRAPRGHPPGVGPPEMRSPGGRHAVEARPPVRRREPHAHGPEPQLQAGVGLRMPVRMVAVMLTVMPARTMRPAAGVGDGRQRQEYATPEQEHEERSVHGSSLSPRDRWSHGGGYQIGAPAAVRPGPRRPRRPQHPRRPKLEPRRGLSLR